MCTLLHNNRVGISGNIIHFLTCFVRIPARNSVNPIIKTTRFSTLVIDKKNNQTSVFDADREIPTLGSTDNAGNSVNLVSGIIRLPLG